MCPLSLAYLPGNLRYFGVRSGYGLLHLAGGISAAVLQWLEVARLVAGEEVGMEDGGQVLENP